MGSVPDLLVIGMGLSGLAAAWRACQRGKRVKVIATGGGALFWHTGCIDVLGYEPQDAERLVESPAQTLKHLVKDYPDHPYSYLGIDQLEAALTALSELCASQGIPYQGSLEKNWLLPSAVGAVRPTCMAPSSMVAGDLTNQQAMLILGFQGYLDFYPEWVAANISALGLPCRAAMLNIPSLQEKTFITSRVLAESFDRPGFTEEVLQELRTLYKKYPDLQASRIGFPAVLGIQKHMDIVRQISDALSAEIFEIPTIPPSIPGIRLHRMLVDAIQSKGSRVFDGMQVIEAQITSEGMINKVFSESAARRKPHQASQFILATGGLLGGGLSATYANGIQEPIFNLPVKIEPNRHNWIQQEFLSTNPHPIYTGGITVDQELRPLNHDHSLAARNLRVVGANLAGGDYLRQRAVDGIALLSGYLAGEWE